MVSTHFQDVLNGGPNRQAGPMIDEADRRGWIARPAPPYPRIRASSTLASQDRVTLSTIFRVEATNRNTWGTAR